MLHKYVYGGLASLIAVLCALLWLSFNKLDQRTSQLATAQASIEFIAQQTQLEKDAKAELQLKVKDIITARKTQALVDAEQFTDIRRQLNEIASTCVLNPKLYRVFMESYKSASGDGMQTD